MFGKAAAIDGLVAGTVVPMGLSMRITARIIATDTTHVVAAESGALTVTRPIAEVMVREGISLPAASAIGQSPPVTRPIIKGAVTGLSNAATLAADG